MLIKVTNLTKFSVSIQSLTATVAPYALRSINTPDDALPSQVSTELNKLVTAGHISFTTSEDPNVDDSLEAPSLAMIDGYYRIDMDDAADVGGGGTTQTVGFQMVNSSDVPVKTALLVEFSVFDDADLSAPATTATLDTAAEGTIAAGAASASLKVRTDALGRFSCTLTDTADETVYLACSDAAGGPSLDCREVDLVTFSV